jgi:hypothetical protein
MQEGVSVQEVAPFACAGEISSFVLHTHGIHHHMQLGTSTVDGALPEVCAPLFLGSFLHLKKE